MKKLVVLILLQFLAVSSFAQIENLRLSHPVYDFLHIMKVRGVVSNFHYDAPNRTYHEISILLDTIKHRTAELSETEKSLFEKYYREFNLELSDSKNGFDLLKDGFDFEDKISGISSDREKYLFRYQGENLNFKAELIGHIYGGIQTPEAHFHSFMIDGGFKLRGTFLKHFGYDFTVDKGIIQGSRGVSAQIKPELLFDTKFTQAVEEASNYGTAEGYINYFQQFDKDFLLNVQLGREQFKLGYGYGSRLIHSGDAPMMDLIKFRFQYGNFHYQTIHASSVGYFTFPRIDNYTKHFVYKKVKLSLPNLFDFGLGEGMVYADRGIEISYLNPLMFYKFAELSTQDRDNSIFWADFQLNAIKDFEFQATWFMDETVNIYDLNHYSSKVAYQFGMFFHSPLGVNDLSIWTEFTRIRPFVYSHLSIVSDYTAYGTIVGHRIGPNADELLLGAGYNFSGEISAEVEYRYVIRGQNVYDDNGQLIHNYGSEILKPYEKFTTDDNMNQLSGPKINMHLFSTSLRFEIVRELYLDIVYNYSYEKNENVDSTLNNSFAYMKLTIDY